jgi:25S rRNA (uracil2843-N3)-methyltransferase
MSKKFTRQEKSQPKHPIYSSTNPITREASVPKTFSSRPAWRGTGFQKPKKRATPKVVSKSEREEKLQISNCAVSLELQQKLLDVVRNAFPVCAKEYEALRPVLTDVKMCLDATAGASKETERSFAEAGMREVFLVRWGVERGLLMGALLAGWAQGEFKEEAVFERLRTGSSSSSSPLNVVSLGTGAAELMALAALLRQGGTLESVDFPRHGETAAARQPLVRLRVVQDSTNWVAETTALHTALLAEPVLSKYASAAAKAAARPFLAGDALAFHYHSLDILEELTAQELAPLVSNEPCLISMCFSLREIQLSSMPKTVNLLIALTKAAPKDSLLVIIDDVESRDGAGVSKVEKRYPLRFLLDLALLEIGVKEKEQEGSDTETGTLEAAWKRLVADEERIFKVNPSLEYPLRLGKQVVQVHLFKRR